MRIFWLWVALLLGSQAYALETHLCGGETFLKDPNSPKPIPFKFKARSTLEPSETEGRYRIVYDFVIYTNWYQFNGLPFLVEWTATNTERVRDTGRLIPSPLYDVFDERRFQAENRFMRMDARSLFTATIYPRNKAALNPDTVIRVYNRELEEIYSAACPGYVELPNESIYTAPALLTNR